MTPAAAMTFLDEAAAYFDKLVSRCDSDTAFWAYTNNAKCCREIAALIGRMTPLSRSQAAGGADGTWPEDAVRDGSAASAAANQASTTPFKDQQA